MASADILAAMGTAPISDRRRFYKRAIGLIVLTIIIVIPLTHYIWGRWVTHRFNQTMSALRSAGEPLTASELKLSPVPDNQNASLDFLAAGLLINPNSPAWKIYDDALGSEFQTPLTDSEQKTVSTIVHQGSAALTRAAASRGKTFGPWNDGTGYSAFVTLLDIDLKPSHRLCNLLRLAAIDAHSRGNDGLSVDLLSDGLALADASQDRPSLVAHLVAMGESQAASESISKLAADFHIGANGLSRKQVTDLLNRLQDESYIDAGNKLAWRTERIMGLNFLTSLVDGRLVAGNTGPANPLWSKGRNFGYLIRPIVLNDARMYALHLQGILTATQAPDWPSAHRLMPTALPAMIKAHPMYHMSLVMLAPSFEKAVKLGYIAKSQRRLAAVALAVRIYAADHNDQLPKSLDDLVPTYLPTIPIDTVTGTPLRFKSNPPRIYGLGDDGVDYGGVPQDPESTDKVRRHHGDNVVYLVTQPRKPAVPQ